MIAFLSTTMSVLEDVLVPICVCVVLPCLIVFIVSQTRKHEMNRKAEVAMKALEKGESIGPEFFGKKSSMKKKTYKGMVFAMLKNGLVCSGIGAAFIICKLAQFGFANNEFFFGAGLLLFFIGAALIAAFFFGRKHFAVEIKAEEDKIGDDQR